MLTAPPAQREAFARRAFGEFDVNADGKVTGSEFQKVFAQLQATEDAGGGSNAMVSRTIFPVRPTLFDATLFPSFSNRFAQSRYQAMALMDVFDSGGDGVVTLDEMLAVVSPAPDTPPAAPLTPDERATELMHQYDVARKGYIDLSDVATAWINDPALGDVAEAVAAIEAWDQDGDGKVTRGELVAAYETLAAADALIALGGGDHGSVALAGLTDETLAPLGITKDALAAMDRDADGVLTRAEILDGLRAQKTQPQTPGDASAYTAALMARYDADRGGRIELGEFRAIFASLDLDEAAVQGYFSAWDEDRDGSISADELTGGIDFVQKASEIIAAYDADAKGWIDAADLQRALDAAPDAQEQPSAMEIMSYWDLDGDGKVTPGEVISMLYAGGYVDGVQYFTPPADEAPEG